MRAVVLISAVAGEQSSVTFFASWMIFEILVGTPEELQAQKRRITVFEVVSLICW